MESMSETAAAGPTGHRHPPERAWWLQLSRKLGATVGRVTATVGSRRTPRTRRSTDALLGELGRIVSEHTEAGYATLENEPQFWALVNHLHVRHREMRHAPGPAQAADKGAAKAPAKASGDDGQAVVDAEVSAIPEEGTVEAEGSQGADSESNEEGSPESDQGTEGAQESDQESGQESEEEDETKGDEK
ncbi:MAG: hypothetical protein DRJ42_23345 [Deltaproteobacteria bacterium]|nr:MAG: hypothetical protein DRJ42_23345 [Deltaproteobacteria bacterium]